MEETKQLVDFDLLKPGYWGIARSLVVSQIPVQVEADHEIEKIEFQWQVAVDLHNGEIDQFVGDQQQHDNLQIAAKVVHAHPYSPVEEMKSVEYKQMLVADLQFADVVKAKVGMQHYQADLRHLEAIVDMNMEQ